MNKDILEKFSTHLKSVLVRAYTLAHELQHSVILPEHLLWSLLTEKGSIGAEILHKLKLSPDRVRASLAASGARAKRDEPENPIPKLSPATKRVIEKAVLTANIHDHKYVGTEHLLAGMLQIEDVGIEQVLEAERIDRKDLRVQLTTVLKSTSKFPDIAEGLTTADGAPARLTKGKERELRKPAKRNDKTPALDFFSVDLTAAEAQKRIDPIIGRDTEIERMIQIISRRTKNNPLLLGDPGVGKTAIVEGLAKRIVLGEVPAVLRDKRVLALDLPMLIAGTIYRGEFEGRLKQVIDEVKAHPEIILFIDEVHTIAGAGSASGSLDAANILKPALARGEIRCIGATTREEYKKHIEGDSALDRRFQPVQVGEPSAEETVQILRGIRENYESFHGVKISDAALEAAVRYAERYLQDRYFPDKAIDLIDEAAASVRVKARVSIEDKNLREAEEEISIIRKNKQEAVASEKFVDALDLKEREIALGRSLEDLRKKAVAGRAPIGRVGEREVAAVVSRVTGVPAREIAAEERARLLNLEAELKGRVVGQDEVIHGVAEYIRRARAGLTDGKRPLASFLFMGPSGVGKTELAKAISEVVFGSADAMHRLDMSEFGESFTVSKLIGSPAGYVGYRDSTKLTDQIKRKPYSVVLFDEIEKAHPDVLNLLLQILEDGILTDATGKRVSFKNAVVILTSNVGIERFIRGPMGFSEGESEDVMKDIAREAQSSFRPELLNRLDRLFVFRQLQPNDLETIVGMEIEKLRTRLADRDLALEVSNGVISLLAKRGIDPEGGARGIRRLIQTELEGPLAERLIAAEVQKPKKLLVNLKGKTLTFRTH